MTAAFNYRDDPRLMAEFLWWFNHLSAMKQGHDKSIEVANLLPKVDGWMREKLGIKEDSIPLYKYKVPRLKGMGHTYGLRPLTQNQSLVSRCTHSLSMIRIPMYDVDCGASTCDKLGSLGDRDVDPCTGEDKIIEKGLWSEE